MTIPPRGWKALAACTVLALVLGGCGKSHETATKQPDAQTNSQTNAEAGGAASGTQASALRPSPAPITVPRGTRLAVRMGETISVKTASAGERFTGTVAEPVVVANTVAIPSGSLAAGEVVRAHRRGRFKGRSYLVLTLTSLDIGGTHYSIDTSGFVRTKKGKGKRTAALIGGGSGLGMLIGGLATGGTGLLIGGLAGGGAGTLGAAFTGNRDISIPAESVVRFRLEDGLTLRPGA